MKCKIEYIRILLVAIIVVTSCISCFSQIYDGITQSDRFRIWGAISQPFKGGKASASTYFGYKQEIYKWFNITSLAKYNFSTKAFMPAIWFNFNIDKRYYLLTRSIYDFKEKRYIQSLAVTIKLPAEFMIDATWDYLYNGRRWCDSDRLQTVVGMNLSRIRTIFNIGYSFRTNKGMMGTIRYKFNNHLWIQMKIDSGIKTADLSMAYNFN